MSLFAFIAVIAAKAESHQNDGHRWNEHKLRYIHVAVGFFRLSVKQYRLNKFRLEEKIYHICTDYFTINMR